MNSGIEKKQLLRTWLLNIWIGISFVAGNTTAYSEPEEWYSMVCVTTTWAYTWGFKRLTVVIKPRYNLKVVFFDAAGGGHTALHCEPRGCGISGGRIPNAPCVKTAGATASLVAGCPRFGLRKTPRFGLRIMSKIRRYELSLARFYCTTFPVEPHVTDRKL